MTRPRGGPRRPTVALAAVAALATAAPASAPRRSAWSPPSAPLPALPVIARVRLDVAPDHVVLTEDVRIARGEAPLGADLRLHVAFGAPGAPRAFDAHLLPGDPDALDPLASGGAGEVLPVDRVPARAPGAIALLGPAHMSGAAVRVPPAAFARACAPRGAALLRLRTLLELPPAGVRGARELVVRLGAEGGPPLALARIEVGAAASSSVPAPALAAVEARLCGPGADETPLAVVLGGARVAPSSRGAAPLLVARRATDDLCVALVATPAQN